MNEFRNKDGAVIKVGDPTGDDPLNSSSIRPGDVELIWPPGSPDAVGSGRGRCDGAIPEWQPNAGGSIGVTMTDKPDGKRPHPIRLPVFMLIGIGAATLFSRAVQGRGPELAGQFVHGLIYAVCGALGGIELEFFVRWGQCD